MDSKFGVIEKTGKREFMERMMRQVPKVQEVKLDTLETENNEGVTKKTND